MGGIHIAEALRIPYYRAFTVSCVRFRSGRPRLIVDALDPDSGISPRVRCPGTQARRSVQLHDVHNVRSGLLEGNCRTGESI